MDCSQQAPLSMGLSRQEYWSGLPFPSPGDLPDPGMEPVSPVSLALQADSLPAEPSNKPLSSIELSFIEGPLMLESALSSRLKRISVLFREGNLPLSLN